MGEIKSLAPHGPEVQKEITRRASKQGKQGAEEDREQARRSSDVGNVSAQEEQPSTAPCSPPIVVEITPSAHR